MTPLLPDKNVILQERDLALIHMLTEEFRILSREQIGELFPMGSTTRLNIRLKQLRDGGYLSSRPLSGLGAAIKHGYYLGPRAKELFDCQHRNKTTAFSPVVLLGDRAISGDAVRTL